MNRLLITTGTCLTLLFSFGQQNQKTNSRFELFQLDSTNNQLVRWFKKKIDSAMHLNNIPAVSVAIVKEGRIILSEGFGFHDRSETVRANSFSVYQIASDTKKMTGIIAKHLVNQGKLNLDTPIVHYLIDSLEPEAEERLRNITVRHLLRHTSGLPYRELTEKRKDGEPMLVPYTEEDVLNDLNSVELLVEPGTKFGYSNFGYAVAGYLCEQASGETYQELIRKYISEAYDMPNTTIVLTNEQKTHLVTPYRKEDRSKATSAFTMGKLAAAGGVYSNVNDLSKLIIQQINAYQSHNRLENDRNPLVLNEDIDVKENGYGFGLGKKVFETGIQFGHGGDLDGFASGYIFSPQYKSGVIILTSSGGRWIGELEKILFHKLTDRL